SILATPIALGGVHNSIAAVIAATGLLGLLWEQARRMRKAQTPEIVLSIPALGLSFFALVCLIQVLPVPSVIQRVINPAGYAGFGEGWQVAWPDQEFSSAGRTLSVEPKKTAACGLRWLSLAVFSFLVVNLAFNRTLWRRLLWTVMASGVVVW